jgi:hypothetical protein
LAKGLLPLLCDGTPVNSFSLQRLLELQSPDEAISNLQDVLAREPNSAMAFRQLAFAYSARVRQLITARGANI